jgi:predicted ATPase/class 3 adenylate cyclase
MARRRAVPTGTLTFLFSDIEDSTRLVQELDTARYRELLEQHQALLRASFAAHGGIERSTEGDSFFVVFRDAPSAVAAAVDGQRELSAADWPSEARVRVRMGLHSGEGIQGGDDYVGIDVHRAARIAAAAHGGQVLVSESTRALAQHALPRDVALIDLGGYHLKGLASPERLYQLSIGGLPSSFPPPRTDPVARAHLPPRLTSFVGRRPDLDVLRGLLGDSRLITLIGPGGTGKTSMAIECAREVSGDFSDGAWFVALEAISDPDLVPSAIVGALGLQDPSGRTARDQLAENLAGRELLLVLDNFEQVMAASALLGEILGAAPAVKVIATSRAPLHLSAEQVYPVAPLEIPSIAPAQPPGWSMLDSAALEALGSVPAIRLFVDRVRQVQPAFELSRDNASAVAEICVRLDGLPLGIELAAARVPLLGTAGVAERLVRRLSLPPSPSPDAPARQRTLQETIAWSCDLLDLPGRALFARLSVFSGGWRLDEAEVVCGPAPELGAEVLDTLAGLVDQSLVIAREHRGVVRYEMLETVRQFADDQLAAREDGPTIRRRHALVYLALAEAAAPNVRRRGRAATLERIGPERANLRAAVRWSIESGEAEIALRLTTALVEARGAPPWGLAGGIEEARSAILTALDLPGADEPTTIRMRCLEAAGTVCYYSGDNPQAATFYRAQLELAQQLGDPQGVADARLNLVWTEDWTGRVAEARKAHKQVEAAYRALGDEHGLARVSFIRGNVLIEEGRLSEAIEVFERARERFREFDDVPYESMTAGSLGRAYLEAGDRDRAIHYFLRGVVGLAREVDDQGAMTMTLPIGAIAALELGRPEAAAVIMGASETLSRAYGIRPPIGLNQVFTRFDPLARARAELDPAAFEAALQRGRAMRLDQAVSLVLEMDTAGEDSAAPASVAGQRSR